MDGKTSEWRPGPTVCRCCLTEGCYKDISTEYFWMGKREVYSEMLSETFNVSIAYSQSGGPNSNSRLICEPCISKLRDASEFKRQVQECEKTFIQHLDPGTSVVLDVETAQEQPDKSVKLERVKLEKHYSDDDIGGNDFAGGGDADDADEDDDDDLDDQPLTKFVSKVPKKESVDILDLLDNSQLTVKRKSKTKAPPAKKVKLAKKETPVKATASKPVTKPVEKKKKDDEALEWTANFVPKAKTAGNLASRLNTIAKGDVVIQNAITILRQTTAYTVHYNNGTYGCFFCNRSFEDPHLYRLHIDSDHPRIDKAIVTLKSYKKLIRIDITDMRCRICGTYYPTLEAIALHLNEDHKLEVNVMESLGLVPLKLRKDHYVCIVCDKKYTGFKALSVHTGSHYGRVICDVCGKKFENASSVKTHVSRRHTVACSICKKSFPTAKARTEHVRGNEACYPFRCNSCKRRFLFWERLQDHLEAVHGKEKREHPCTDCDKVFTKRTQLYFHFKVAHTDDHKCEECGQRFRTKRHLSEHLSDHSGLRPLQCTECPKTFTREKNLKRHLITHDDSKKHACTVCNGLFVERSKLRTHVRKRHSDVYDRLFSS